MKRISFQNFICISQPVIYFSVNMVNKIILSQVWFFINFYKNQPTLHAPQFVVKVDFPTYLSRQVCCQSGLSMSWIPYFVWRLAIMYWAFLRGTYYTQAHEIKFIPLRPIYTIYSYKFCHQYRLSWNWFNCKIRLLKSPTYFGTE